MNVLGCEMIVGATGDKVLFLGQKRGSDSCLSGFAILLTFTCVHFLNNVM
jgi:hypothetical protein